jgi:3-oxoacyl-[acyl-carrier protein] reductase
LCGLSGLAKSLSVPLGKSHGIRVNAVLPGTVRPGSTDKVENKDYDLLTKGIILGKMAEESDIADTVFLLANDLKHITGQEIIVDGGQTVIRAQK